MTKLEKNQDKNRSNTRKTRWKKMRNIAWIGAFALGTTLMTGCGGNKESDLTKLSKKHDAAIENVKTQEEEKKEAQEELKEAEKKVEKETQDVIDAKEEKEKLEIELKKAKINPEK